MPDEPIRVALPERAAWVTAASNPDGVTWIAVLESGRVMWFTVARSAVVEADGNLNVLPEGAPPAAAVSDTGLLLLAPPSPTGSPATNPIPLSDGGLAFVGRDGSVVTVTGTGNRTFEVNGLVDGRLVESGDGLVAVLADPTDRYPHAVLGDSFEPSSVVALSPASRELAFETTFEDDVVETLAPLWADVDDDGLDELLITLSNPSVGARLAVLSEDGTVAAESEPIGRGGRWRHLVAVAPFGPDGELEVAEVVTPHIGGIVQFHRLAAAALTPVASASGYTSHVIGSRNLDMALAADADGDGQTELVLTTQDRSTLVGLQRSDEGIEVAWEFKLGDRLVTNLAGVDHEGSFGLALGTGDKTLLIWPPQSLE